VISTDPGLVETPKSGTKTVITGKALNGTGLTDVGTVVAFTITKYLPVAVDEPTTTFTVAVAVPDAKETEVGLTVAVGRVVMVELDIVGGFASVTDPVKPLTLVRVSVEDPEAP